jgi:hypothetical protein
MDQVLRLNAFLEEHAGITITPPGTGYSWTATRQGEPLAADPSLRGLLDKLELITDSDAPTTPQDSHGIPRYLRVSALMNRYGI